jgi:hypothetical protein
MSGVEGAECEDYDDGQAGVGLRLEVEEKKHQPLRTRRITKEILARFDTVLCVCRIEG